MVTLKCCLVLLAATIIAVCSEEEQPLAEQASCSASFAQRKYATFDISHSLETGIAEDVEYDIPPKTNKWCMYTGTRKFRTFDGTCNHFLNLGASSTPLDSLLRPEYDDGVDSPRQRGEDGQPLPSARKVSLKLHPAVDDKANFPFILTQYGQFYAHDAVNTASTPGRINCCGPNGACQPIVNDKNCFPIQLPEEEDYFPGTCLSFVRSLAADKSNPLELRQQINTVTHFHDGSQIYGSSDDQAAKVREPGSYLLRTKHGSLLPEDVDGTCIKNRPHHYCFLAGDNRVNQNPYLGALTTIFVREHNRIARRLKVLKPQETNETIFQLARKINIAIQQVVTYNGYLPIILGEDASQWGLTSFSGRSHYNPGLDPGIFTSFSTAAFRQGHSGIDGAVAVGSRLLQLRNLFNNPGEVIDHFDDVVAGMSGVANASQRSMQKIDRNFVRDVSKFLFMNLTTGKGLDLVTINIQRGRDHGLPPYHKWRSFCGLRPLTGFNDVLALGPFVAELGKVYKSVNDIDLYTGMLHEPVDNGLVGPTIRCILRVQFFRTKFGDRFFFDNDEPASAFTNLQLSTLRAVTLSRVMCHNSKLTRLPKDVFRFQSSSNPWVNCSTLKGEDLNLAFF